MYKFLIILMILSVEVFASGRVTSLQDMAETLVDQFVEIASLMIAVAYVAGIGFGISAMYKFKQHKDNPQQTPVGTAIALLAISVLLIFLPAIYVPAGQSLFGIGAQAGSASGDLTALPGAGQS